MSLWLVCEVGFWLDTGVILMRVFFENMVYKLGGWWRPSFSFPCLIFLNSH